MIRLDSWVEYGICLMCPFLLCQHSMDPAKPQPSFPKSNIVRAKLAAISL